MQNKSVISCSYNFPLVGERYALICLAIHVPFVWQELWSICVKVLEIYNVHAFYKNALRIPEVALTYLLYLKEFITVGNFLYDLF